MRADRLGLSVMSLVIYQKIWCKKKCLLLTGLELEDLKEAIVPSAGDVALLLVPAHAPQPHVVGDGDLGKEWAPESRLTRETGGVCKGNFLPLRHQQLPLLFNSEKYTMLIRSSQACHIGRLSE